MAEDKKTVTADPEVVAQADTNGDGHILKEEYEMELESQNVKRLKMDAQRCNEANGMVCIVPYVTAFFAVVLASLIGLDPAGKIGDMAATYFVLAAIVMAFIAGNAYNDAKKK